MKEWCSHIVWHPDFKKWTDRGCLNYHNSDHANWVQDCFTLCPICGTQRPEKEKELWKKFYAVWEKGSPIVNLHKLTHVALEHFTRVVEFSGFLTSSETSRIIEAMRKSV